MFLKMVIPDKPTFYPIILPDDEVKKITEANPINLETLVKTSWVIVNLFLSYFQVFIFCINVTQVSFKKICVFCFSLSSS